MVDENKQISLYQQGHSEKILRIFIVQYTPLLQQRINAIVSARLHNCSNVDRNDAWQEALLAVHFALINFDSSRGIKFITVLKSYLDTALRNFKRDCTSPFKASGWTNQKMIKIRMAKQQLLNDMQEEEISIEKIVEKSELSSKDVTNLKQATEVSLASYHSIFEGKEDTHECFIDINIHFTERIINIAMLDILEAKHKEIMYRMYFKEEDINDIAKDLNMSCQGVRYAHDASIKKLRRTFKNNT